MENKNKELIQSAASRAIQEIQETIDKAKLLLKEANTNKCWTDHAANSVQFFEFREFSMSWSPHLRTMISHVYPDKEDLLSKYENDNYKVARATYWGPKAKEMAGLVIYKEMVKGCGSGRTAYIDLLSIDPNYQSQGVGTALIDAMRRKYDTLILSCPIDSDSNGFYEHMGFKKRAYEWVL